MVSTLPDHSGSLGCFKHSRLFPAFLIAESTMFSSLKMHCKLATTSSRVRLTPVCILSVKFCVDHIREKKSNGNMVI